MEKDPPDIKNLVPYLKNALGETDFIPVVGKSVVLTPKALEILRDDFGFNIDDDANFFVAFVDKEAQSCCISNLRNSLYIPVPFSSLKEPPKDTSWDTFEF